MAARAYWQGQIKLALVTIPVEVYPATRSGAAISFNQIHEPSGQRIRYEKVVPGIGPVNPDDIVKGYEISDDNYVLLDDEEIEAVQIESRRTLDLVQFVPRDEIDVLYYEKPYFILPADELAEEAYGVLRDALNSTGKVGLGQLSVRGREQLVAIKPCGKGLVLEVLRYADEVHKASSFFRDVSKSKGDPDLIEMATALIERKTAPFSPEDFHDRYVEGLERLIEKKRKAGSKRRILEDAGEPAQTRGLNVVDLMAALKKSVGQNERSVKRGSASPPARAKARPSAARSKKPASKKGARAARR